MAFQKEKIVQSYIQGLIEVITALEKADSLAQMYKEKYIASNVDLSGTNITQSQIDVINTFINDINILVNKPFISIIKSKDFPSHGVKSLG